MLFVYIALFLFSFLYYLFIFLLIPSNKQIIDVYSQPLKTNKKNMKKYNIKILKILKYYNINTNDTKKEYIYKLVTSLLFGIYPNIKNVSIVNDVEVMHAEFEKMCVDKQKNKIDFTVRDIQNFVLTCDLYKKLQKELYYSVERAMILSKFININKKIDNALTERENKYISQYFF
jgi:hypothetical protein